MLEAAVVGTRDEDELVKPEAFIVLKIPPAGASAGRELLRAARAASRPTNIRAGSSSCRAAQDRDRQDPALHAARGVTRIRPFEPADLEACYAISLATGFEGGDASHLYRDPKMMGHIYIAPLRPARSRRWRWWSRTATAWRASPSARQTRSAWEERLEREWWPSLRGRYADPAGVPPADRTPDQRRAFMIHHRERRRRAEYPAHLHNLSDARAASALWMGRASPASIHLD